MFTDNKETDHPVVGGGHAKGFEGFKPPFEVKSLRRKKWESDEKVFWHFFLMYKTPFAD